MATTNGDSLREPVISIEFETIPCLHPSNIDNSLYENHKSQSIGTPTYKYILKLEN